jgi:hypothetical protein
LFSNEGFLITQKISPPVRGVSHVEGADMVGLLREMLARLVADFDFEQVKLAGEAHLNRTTEPVVRFLLWLEKTPEARTSSRLALKRLAGKPHLG